MALDCKPKYVSFDMNGTLIHFRINDAIRRVLGDRLPAEIAGDFLQAGNAYRIDECMGEWKPFHQIVGHSLERTVRRFGLEYRDGDGRAVRIRTGAEPDMGLPDIPMIDFFGRGGRLKPSWYGDCLPSRDFPMLIDLYLQGRFDLDRFVSETIALDDVEEAFHKMERGEVLRSVVVL